MSLSEQSWYGAAAGYLGMWMAMMVPMMLPSIIPMLSRYREAVRGSQSLHLHGLTVLVALGYFIVWAVLGVAAYAGGRGLMAIQVRWELDRLLPIATGAVLLVAGGVQLTTWKGRQLALCRDAAACSCPPPPNALGAWRHGLRLGLRCSLCCGSVMVALLAVGRMDLSVMAAGTVAIAGERWTPPSLRVAHVVGLAIAVVGVMTIARV